MTDYKQSKTQAPSYEDEVSNSEDDIDISGNK